MCSKEGDSLPHSSESLMGEGGWSHSLPRWSFVIDVLGSQEWNFEDSLSFPEEGEPFNFWDAFRISAGVSIRVPQALRNLACKMNFVQSRKVQYMQKFDLRVLIYRYTHQNYFEKTKL